jgi:hypothetical protein
MTSLDRFEVSSSIKLHENASIESRDVPCGWTDGWTDGQTDGPDKANSHFSQYFECT